MQYLIYGFFLGFVIPYIARRFAKFAPASPAEAVWRVVFPVKWVRVSYYRRSQKYKALMSSYFWRSFVYGILTTGLFYLASFQFSPYGLGGFLAFFWALFLLMEIDYKTFLLPDVVTIPLLIGGFVFSVFNGFPAESALGAVTGYLIPVIAGLFIVWKYPHAFGGGDIKMLAAVGAWLGILPVIYTILLSCIFFAVFAFVMRRRDGAFGPAISVAAIIVAFYFF